MENENTVGLVKETVEDIKKLVELQVSLLRAEVSGAMEKSKRIAVLGFLAGFGLLPAALFLGLFLSHSLQQSADFTEWQADLIVFGISILPSLILIYRLKRLYRSVL